MRVLSQGYVRLRDLRRWGDECWSFWGLERNKCEGIVMGMCCCSVWTVITGGGGGGLVEDILQAVVVVVVVVVVQKTAFVVVNGGVTRGLAMMFVFRGIKRRVFDL